MKRILTGLLAAVVFFVGALALTGCGSEQKTIEDLLSESPSAQQDIEDSLAGLNNSDMDTEVTYDQNKIIITCTMKTTYKKKVLKAIKKSYKKYLEENLTAPMENAAADIERETGITGVQIQVIINNGDGEGIWSETYPIGSDEAPPEESSEGVAEESAEDSSEGTNE